MSEILLSICIPTYNRGTLLNLNLLEIIKQADQLKNKIEICISDNASIDKTDEIIKLLPTSDYVILKYFKNEKNIGPDLNYLNAVNLASGKYCWFMGSDDIISPNSLNKLIQSELLSDSDIYICNRIDCDYDMKPFFYNKRKMFCYFGKSKSKKQLYVGIVKGSEIKHPSLIKGKRKMIKIFKVNPAKDIDIVSLYEVLELAKACYSKVV